MVIDIEKVILSSSQRLGSLLKDRGLVVGTAESCTGGWLGQAITIRENIFFFFDIHILIYSIPNIAANTTRICITPIVYTPAAISSSITPNPPLRFLSR